MKALVTGAAGFIGSTLVERLLDDGDEVVGVDCFTEYYDPAVKRRNIAGAWESDRFVLHDLDLRTADLSEVFENVDVVFHSAGQPGVRLSWDQGFQMYDSCNILATQRLLEAAVQRMIDSTVIPGNHLHPRMSIGFNKLEGAVGRSAIDDPMLYIRVRLVGD